MIVLFPYLRNISDSTWCTGLIPHSLSWHMVWWLTIFPFSLLIITSLPLLTTLSTAIASYSTLQLYKHICRFFTMLCCLYRFLPSHCFLVAWWTHTHPSNLSSRDADLVGRTGQSLFGAPPYPVHTFMITYVPLDVQLLILPDNLNPGLKFIEVKAYVLFDFELSALSSVLGMQ